MIVKCHRNFSYNLNKIEFFINDLMYAECHINPITNRVINVIIGSQKTEIQNNTFWKYKFIIVQNNEKTKLYEKSFFNSKQTFILEKENRPLTEIKLDSTHPEQTKNQLFSITPIQKDYKINCAKNKANEVIPLVIITLMINGPWTKWSHNSVV